MTVTVERDPSTLSRMERALLDVHPSLRHLAPRELAGILPPDLAEMGKTAWHEWFSRPNQRLPEGDWGTWILRMGRGAGKSRSGSEGVRRLVNQGRAGFITICGKSPAEARDVMIDGPTGIRAVSPRDLRPDYESSKRLLTWPNGAIGHVRSAADPDSLRGLNSDLVWFDEPASMPFGQEAWDNAMLGNRVGVPHAILTGTPRPLPWLRELEKKPRTVVTTGSTYDNVLNLASEFVELVLDRYEGTRLGAQEIHAQYLDDVEGALWTLGTFEAARITRFNPSDPWRSFAVAWAGIADRFGRAPELFTKERRRWVTAVGVDPPGETAECGIVVATAPMNGVAARDHAVVLADRSLAGTPETWGAEVVAAYHAWNADVIVVESNQGGDMVRSTIHNVDPTVNVEKVRAKDSKSDRAEPISVLDGKGWIHHLGQLPQLEDQCCTWVPTEGKSPDRIDARVHVLTHLLRPITLGRASLPDQSALAAQRL